MAKRICPTSGCCAQEAKASIAMPTFYGAFNKNYTVNCEGVNGLCLPWLLGQYKNNWICPNCDFVAQGAKVNKAMATFSGVSLMTMH